VYVSLSLWTTSYHGATSAWLISAGPRSETLLLNSLGMFVELVPAVLRCLRILELVNSEGLHGTNVLNILLFLEMRNGPLIEVNREELLDHVPVLNIFLPLLNLHGDIMNHVLLARVFLEHGFELELAVLKFIKRLLIFIESLNACSLPAIA